MSKPNRNRKHSICVRMNDEEYNELRMKLQESGQTMQSYVNNAIHGGVIATPEEVQALRELNRELDEASRLFRGTANNVNQMAHNINLLIMLLQDEHPDWSKADAIVSSLPRQGDLKIIAQHVVQYRKDIDQIWQSLRQYMAQQKPTPVSATQ